MLFRAVPVALVVVVCYQLSAATPLLAGNWTETRVRRVPIDGQRCQQAPYSRAHGGDEECAVRPALSANVVIQPSRLRDQQRRRMAFLTRIRDFRVSYEVVPSYDKLTWQQRRLVQSLPSCSTTSRTEDCWEYGLSRAARATFFMITYVLEHTDFNGRPFIGRVTSVEGLLAAPRVRHEHVLTGATREVDGWRMHLMLDGVSSTQLDQDGWDRSTTFVHPTHTTFGYEYSYRDRREKDRWEGPFLQLVLDHSNRSSDSDLDKGEHVHVSSPKELYHRFGERYAEVRDVLVVR